MAFKQLCYEVYGQKLISSVYFLGFCLLGFYFYFSYIPNILGGSIYISVTNFFILIFVFTLSVGMKRWAYPGRSFFDNENQDRKKIVNAPETTYYILSWFLTIFMFWYSCQNKIGFLIMGILSICAIVMNCIIAGIQLIPFQLVKARPLENKAIRIIGTVATTILIVFTVFSFVYVGKEMYTQKEMDEFLKNQPYTMVDEKNDYIITKEKNLEKIGLLVIDKYFENRKDRTLAYYIDYINVKEEGEVMLIQSMILIEHKPFSSYWTGNKNVGPYVGTYIVLAVDNVSEDKYEIQSIDKDW